MTEPDPAQALDKVFELAGRLSELMHRFLTERQLTAARAEALLVLHRGGPVVQRRLSEALRCTPRHVTTLVDALEEQGMVTRRPHPSDRRATLVALTERGATAAARMSAEREGAARALLGDVSAADLATFVAIADQVLDRIGKVGGPTQKISGEQPSGAAAAQPPGGGSAGSSSRRHRSR